MNLSQTLTFALAASEKGPADAVVVATGLILVFGLLFLLYLIVMLQGKFFVSLDNRKKGKSSDTGATKSIQSMPKVATMPVLTQDTMKIEKGISGEIVAAIAAAVSCLDGGKYTVKSVKRTAKSTRNAWGQAGVATYTEPF